MLFYRRNLGVTGDWLPVRIIGSKMEGREEVGQRNFGKVMDKKFKFLMSDNIQEFWRTISRVYTNTLTIATISETLG